MHRWLRSWRLFWGIALTLSVIDLSGLICSDHRSAQGVAWLILLSVRCCLPLFLIAFVASSLAVLRPAPLTRWLLANRRYVGLAFAFGMCWHFAFVGYSMARFGDHLNSRIQSLDLLGAAFLLALTVTSFRPVARHISPTSWRRLHKVGVYVIWGVASFVSFEFARQGNDPVSTVTLAALLGGWLVRILAAARKWVAARRSAGRWLQAGR